MTAHQIPAVPGVLSATEIGRTAASIAHAQETSGAVPWFSGGHVDPWDHVESAMALSVAGLLDEAEAAYEWLRCSQRSDGSWPLKLERGSVVDAASDSNFCAYIAVGAWHHVLVSRDESFASHMWPSVRRAINFVLGMQTSRGEIGWVKGIDGKPVWDALLSGCSSIHHSLRCALALADHVGDPQPEWEFALGKLGHALRFHPEAFLDKARYSMDWYYPILGGALRGEPALRRLRELWSNFVVDGLGVRCVADRPWVTGAETCELALSLEALGEHKRALDVFASMQHLREADGSYWTGLVYSDGKRWPEERTTWTSAAVILAADALSGTTTGSGIFAAGGLPSGLLVPDGMCGCQRNFYTSGSPN